MKFEIIRVDSGYILKSKLDGEQVEYSAYVDPKSDHKAFTQLLYEITRQAGPTDSRHSPERIYIEIKPGDKWLDANSPPEDVI